MTVKTKINAILTEDIEHAVAGEVLIKRYGGKIVAFRSLPKEAKDALHQWMMVDGENEDYKTQKYSLIQVPTEDLMKLIHGQLNGGQSWEEFWGEPDAPLSFKPSYPKKSVWPIIWGSLGWSDGSHRFERYRKIGLKEVPVLVVI